MPTRESKGTWPTARARICFAVLSLDVEQRRDDYWDIANNERDAVFDDGSNNLLVSSVNKNERGVHERNGGCDETSGKYYGQPSSKFSIIEVSEKP